MIANSAVAEICLRTPKEFDVIEIVEELPDMNYGANFDAQDKLLA